MSQTKNGINTQIGYRQARSGLSHWLGRNPRIHLDALSMNLRKGILL